MEAKGKTLLKVVGILMIIGSAFGILGSLLAIAGGGFVAALGGEAGADATTAASLGGTAILLGIFSLVSGILVLITGITGVKNCGNLEGVKKCQTWGIIALVMAVLSIILTTVTSGFSITSIFGLLLPVLYMIGVNQNKQSAA